MSENKPNEQIPESLKQEAERKYPNRPGKHWVRVLANAQKQAYIAGALSRSGGVWVKASDKLPENDGMVFIRNITTRHGGMIHTNELAKMENLFNVEWLSESPAADKGDAIDGWINVEKELPDYYKAVLVCEIVGRQFVAWRASDDNNEDIYTVYRTDVIVENVTHWRPLPQPPQSK